LPVPQPYLREVKLLIADLNRLQEDNLLTNGTHTARIFLLAPGEMDTIKQQQQQADSSAVKEGKSNLEDYRFIRPGNKITLPSRPAGLGDKEGFDDGF
jgi:hypothetical protein